MERLAITGLGLVSPIGIGRTAFQDALADPTAAREHAFGQAPTVLDPERVPDARGAEVWGFDARQYLGEKGLRNFDRLTKFFIVSAKLALEDAGLKRGGEHVVMDPAWVGICSATAYGSLDAITELNRVAELEDPRYLNPNRFPNTVINSPAGYVGIWEDLRAPNVTLVDGNCGALDAIITCETHLRMGRASAFLVGGGEVLSEPLYLAFRQLGVLAEQGRRCQPGDPNSGGMCIGEGAAYLCIEKAGEAEGRGAPILGEVVGYGSAFEPPESEAQLVHASARSVERAIRAALAEADVSADDIDVVAAAASGMARFDQAELQAVRSVLGDDVTVAVPKQILGETFGGAGALSMATVISWFQGGPVAPTIQGRAPQHPETVLVTAVGYYGNVSAAVLRRHS